MTPLRGRKGLLSRLLRQKWQAKQSSVACQCWPPCATWPKGRNRIWIIRFTYQPLWVCNTMYRNELLKGVALWADVLWKWWKILKIKYGHKKYCSLPGNNLLNVTFQVMTVYCMEILFLVWQQQHVNNMGSSLHLLLEPFFCFTKFVKGQGLTRIVWKRVNAVRLNVVFAFVALLRIVSYCTMYMKQTPWALSKNAFAGTWKSKSTFLEFSHFKRALTLNEKIFFPTLSAHSATLTKKNI